MIMTKKKKWTILYQNPYYHCVIAIKPIKVPSKRPEYKCDENGKIINGNLSKSYIEFEKLVKSALSVRKNPTSPYEDYLQVVIELHVTEGDFDKKDIDNMAKTLLDSFKGCIYKDDSQIVSLSIIKKDTKEPGFIFGVRRSGIDSILPLYPVLLNKDEKPDPNYNLFCDNATNVNVNDSSIFFTDEYYRKRPRKRTQ